MELVEQLKSNLDVPEAAISLAFSEVTLEVPAARLLEVAMRLQQAPFHFECLIDLCGVDYQEYGQMEWETASATVHGFSRGVRSLREQFKSISLESRFAVVYHLLSFSTNRRLRVKVFAAGDPPLVPSVISCWASANWYEREAFDLYGILFDGHPDLRRLLTDYGFVGHPFRKDFPLIGEVELRYDATLGHCVYEPVAIQPRVLVPKVIRKDNRYRPASAKKEGL